MKKDGTEHIAQSATAGFLSIVMLIVVGTLVFGVIFALIITASLKTYELVLTCGGTPVKIQISKDLEINCYKNNIFIDNILQRKVVK